MYEYKTSIEITGIVSRFEVPIIIECEIFDDGEVEIVSASFDPSDSAGREAAVSPLMVNYLKSMSDNLEFDHLQDEILSEVIAEREADRIDRLMDDMSPDWEPVQ